MCGLQFRRPAIETGKQDRESIHWRHILRNGVEAALGKPVGTHDAQILRDLLFAERHDASKESLVVPRVEDPAARVLESQYERDGPGTDEYVWWRNRMAAHNNNASGRNNTTATFPGKCTGEYVQRTAGNVSVS